jgi:hypothetical protein
VWWFFNERVPPDETLVEATGTWLLGVLGPRDA